MDLEMFETFLFALEAKKNRAEKEKFSAREKENSLGVVDLNEVKEEPKTKYSNILEKYGIDENNSSIDKNDTLFMKYLIIDIALIIIIILMTLKTDNTSPFWQIPNIFTSLHLSSLKV